MAKRETGKERRAREDQHRAIFEIAAGIAIAIREGRRAPTLTGVENEFSDYFDRVLNSTLFPRATRIEGEWIKNQSVESISKGLRLAADLLEEKPRDGRRVLTSHDRKIKAAYSEALKRLLFRDDQQWRQRFEGEFRRIIGTKPIWAETLKRIPVLIANQVSRRITAARPTFSEFLKVYREQNPGVKVADRTLRRSLKRLGGVPRSGKRGRPKGK